ncbi:MAG: hemerythrin domain-containing protein [Burkholderiaceae bacterium]|nr:hemerythrin domain-containing protein [Burkholderiaceae bacterium]
MRVHPSSSDDRRPASVRADAPLGEFSHCHEGILSRLEAFADLPALIAAAARARERASEALFLFEDIVIEHHADEESELFPAVLRWAEPGEELDGVRSMIRRLTAEHRSIEKLWQKYRPAVEAAARGKAADLPKDAASELVSAYVAHATFEEEVFLPLARDILSRDDAHMAALGLSLHLRHAPRIPGYI